MSTTYDKAYFIAKFEAIPDSDIGSGSPGRQCAAYHCGLRFGHTQEEIENNAELSALGDLLMPIAKRLFGMDASKTFTRYGAVWRVNDGWCPPENETPKQRILAALKDQP